MKPEEWSRVKEILDECLALEPDLRRAHLEKACGDNSGLQLEVESLLASYAEAGEGFLENPILEEPEELLTGRQIGSYQIGERIAEGGMGAVYRAVRFNDFQKQVAVKVIKRGMDTDFILRRFRQERQILAGLDHPNIARLLDGGATEDGRPYIVMELVEGTPITQYCEDHRLGEAERLKLFRTVCSAVQYAHQNLVVHRDLKPGNILVTSYGEPKLLDFGIAKLMEPDADATMTWMRMLSPECASPEQVRGQAITTASDIYSLGVLLYRLLSGEPPYHFTARTAAEISQVVCEEEPKKPSELRPVHADLDNIVLKAMHKDPARRYASADQFSEDIQRYLDGLPVIARKDTLVYRFSKFVQRHTGASIAAALAVISLMGGMAAMLWQAHRTQVQEQIAASVNDFLRNDLLAQASTSKQGGPDVKPDPNLTVRTALDRAAARIEGKFGGQPLVEASIRQTMAEAYSDLGLYPEAQRQVERALDLRRRALGERDLETLRSMETLGQLFEDEARYSEQEAMESKVLELRRQMLGEQHPETLSSMDDLAGAYRHMGKLAEAEALESKVVAGLSQLYGEEKNETLISMNDLATIYEDEGKFPEAERLYVRSDEIRRRLLGEEHPDTLTGMNNLAGIYSHEGKFAEAEALQSKVLEARRRVLGADHPDTLSSMNNLAVDYTRDGKYAQAEPLLVSLLGIRRVKLGNENPDTLLIMNNLAVVYSRVGKYALAEPLFREALETQTHVLGADNPLTLTCMQNLATLYHLEEKYRQAEALFLKALAGRRRILGPDHPDTLRTLRGIARLYIDEASYVEAETQARAALAGFESKSPDRWERFYAESMLGESLAGQKKYAEAEPLLLDGYDGMMKRAASLPAAERKTPGQAGQWVEQLYREWKKPDKAAEWRRKLQQAAGQGSIR